MELGRKSDESPVAAAFGAGAGGAAPSPHCAVSPAQQIGPYTLLRVLGEGGMGTVYLAEQSAPVRRTVALKLVKLGMDTTEVVARFNTERQALALMNHPNVAAVYDAGATATGRPYFVMECVVGEPITDFCDRHRLTIAERLRLFIPVCHAIQHAHQKGLIHRDIKPSNVLVTLHDGRPVPKVIDFGVAKAMHRSPDARSVCTELGQVIGTPEYMSPEQADLASADIDTRTDVYALGVLLYELLTGTLPLEPRTLRAASFDSVQRILREMEPPRPSTRLSALAERGLLGTLARAASRSGLRQSLDAYFRRTPTPAGVVARPRGAGAAQHPDAPPAVPEIADRRRTDPRGLMRQLRGELDWIVMKCLEKDRARRYDTASALAEDIERHLRTERVLAGPPGAGYRLRKFVQRNRAAVLAATAVALTLLFGLFSTASMLWYALGERDRARLAERQQTQAYHDADRAREREAQQRRRAEAEADAARTQAAVAEAAGRFLSDLLATAAQVDPHQPARATAQELLDAAAVRVAAGQWPIDETASGASDDTARRVEATVCTIIGRAYLSIGQPERAAPLLEQAAAALDSLAGDAPASEASTEMTFVALIETYEALGRADLALAAQARWTAWRARHGAAVP